MKRIYALILIVLTVLSLGGVMGYSIHRAHTTGGRPPEIQFDQDVIKVETNATDERLLDGVTAKDPEDGDVTNSLVVEHVSTLGEGNTVTVTYAAFDSQNHVTRATRTAEYVDYWSPHFTMSRPLIYTTQTVSNMMDDIGANDCIDGDISVKVRASFDDTEDALRSVGVHQVKLMVTNSVGDTSELMVPVRVVEDSPRSDQLPLTKYLIYLEKGTDFDPRAYLAEETIEALYGEDAQDSPNRNDADPLEIISDVDTVTPGVYAAEYQLVRNEQITAATRLIVVVV